MAQFTLPDRTTREMRYQMGFALADLAYEFPQIVALDADLRSSTGLYIFEHFHPAKLVKTGIAEQNVVRMAAGLSREGYVPFPCTFDAFSRRMLDQLYVTVAYSNLNVKFIGAYVGLFTGKAGATHQSDKELGTLAARPAPVNRRALVQPGDAPGHAGSRRNTRSVLSPDCSLRGGRKPDARGLRLPPWKGRHGR